MEIVKIRNEAGRLLEEVYFSTLQSDCIYMWESLKGLLFLSCFIACKWGILEILDAVDELISERDLYIIGGERDNFCFAQIFLIPKLLRLSKSLLESFKVWGSLLDILVNQTETLSGKHTLKKLFLGLVTCLWF